MCVSQVVYECETESLRMSVSWVFHGEMSGWQVSLADGTGLDRANDL